MGESVSATDLQTLLDWAQSNECIRRVWVLGSRVRGEGRPDSDLDVAVEMDAIGRDEQAQTGWMELSPRWRAELGKGLSAPLDLEWIGEVGAHLPKLLSYLARSSVLIYQRADL